MSFSLEVKKELTAVRPERDCCRRAEAYGMAECGHAYAPDSISLLTESPDVAQCYAALLSEACGVQAVLNTRGAGSGFISVTVPQEEERRRMLGAFGDGHGPVTLRINRANFECDGCPAAFLRGAFLVCGAVTNPENDYHLEFSMPRYHLCQDLIALLKEVGLTAKQTTRKGNFVVYFKESEQIEDCLTLMGAGNASLQMMSVKVLKDIRNNANRITNCESANIDKIVTAAGVYIDAVQKISRTVGLSSLPENLRELAQLRLDNPDFSLRDLGEALHPPLSRSGVNHRLQRILDFSRRLPKA